MEKKISSESQNFSRKADRGNNIFFYPRSMINDDCTYCAGDRGAPGGFPGLPGHEQVHVLSDQELQPHQPGVPHTECLTQAIIAYHLYILSFMRKIYISLLL